MVRAKKKALIDHLTPTVKRVMSITLLIGAIGYGVWQIDTYYAKAAEVKVLQENLKGEARQLKEEVQGVRDDLRRVFARSERRALEAEKRTLQREQFDLVAIQQKRKLTELEVKRLQAVTEDIGKLEEQIKGLIDREKSQFKK